MGGKRQAGWPSLLVTFLLATQEKSDSGANGARKLFASNQPTQSKSIARQRAPTNAAWWNARRPCEHRAFHTS
jgi:hypothetical protein